MPRYEDFLEKATQPGMALSRTLTGEKSQLTKYEELLEPPVSRAAPSSPEQAELDAVKYAMGPDEMRNALLRASMIGIGGQGGAYLGRASWLASFLGRGAGEFAGSAVADVAEGRKPDLATAGLTAGMGMGVEAAATGLGYGAARASGVPTKTLRATLNKPYTQRVGTMFGKPSETAELAQSDEAVKAAGRFVGPRANIKTAGRTAAEAKMRQFDLENTQPVANATGTETMDVTRGVDMAPVKNRLRQFIKNEPWRPEEQVGINEMIQRKIDALPDRMSMADFDDWITSHTKKVSGKIGTIDQQLPTDVRREMIRFGRSYRNQVLPEARADFNQASADIGAFKRFRKQIMDIRGDPKIGVESVWRRIDKNQALMRTFERFDEAASRNGLQSNFAEDALQLSRKRDWTSDDVFHAYLLLRGAQRFIIRPLIAKPAIAVAPGLGVGAAAAFSQAMEPRNNP